MEQIVIYLSMEIIKFKAKDSEIITSPLCLGSRLRLLNRQYEKNWACWL